MKEVFEVRKKSQVSNYIHLSNGNELCAIFMEECKNVAATCHNFTNNYPLFKFYYLFSFNSAKILCAVLFYTIIFFTF